MTQKEKQALEKMLTWLQYTKLTVKDGEVFKTDEDGAETQDAFVYESRINHLANCLYKSFENEKLTWEEV